MTDQDYATLRQMFGDKFLLYVLNLDDPRALDALPGGANSERLGILQTLLVLVGSVQQGAFTPDGHAWASRMSIDRYLPEVGHSLANVLRLQAKGKLPVPPRTTDPVLSALFRILVECYPALLLPQEYGGHPRPIASTTFNHPARVDLEQAVLADSVLPNLYTSKSDTAGWSGSAFRSTGQGGTVQLWSFGSQQIDIAYAWASLDSEVPSIEEVAAKLRTSLQTLRRALASKAATVPVRIGLTGILLPSSDTEVDLGWAILHGTREYDRRTARFTGLEGKLQTTTADGTVITIDYSGDVVVSLDVPYKVILGERELGDPWPPELQAVTQGVRDKIESLRLGLALALDDDQPVLAVQSWQVIIDPLAVAVMPGWNDTRRTPNLIPRQLTNEQVERWRLWVGRVYDHRSPATAIAIRRMLRALGERNDPEDVLVDAVVVWENLFGASQETTLRVSTALAWLLGSDAADRAARQKKYKDLYTLRSQIVHGSSRLKAGNVPEESRNAVQISLAALRELFENRPELLAMKKSEERGNTLMLGE